jgi:hypothetical protein
MVAFDGAWQRSHEDPELAYGDSISENKVPNLTSQLEPDLI